MPSDGETSLFKQLFFNWLDKDETTGVTDPYVIGKIAKVPQVPFDAATLHEDKVMAAQHGMVDDGSGKLQVSAIELLTKFSPLCYWSVAILIVIWCMRLCVLLI